MVALPAVRRHQKDNEVGKVKMVYLIALVVLFILLMALAFIAGFVEGYNEATRLCEEVFLGHLPR